VKKIVEQYIIFPLCIACIGAKADWWCV